MSPDSNTTAPAGQKPPSFGTGKFLFAVFLAVLFYWLAQSMVHHNFHQGQRMHRNGSVGQ